MSKPNFIKVRKVPNPRDFIHSWVCLSRGVERHVVTDTVDDTPEFALEFKNFLYGTPYLLVGSTFSDEVYKFINAVLPYLDIYRDNNGIIINPDDSSILYLNKDDSDRLRKFLYKLFDIEAVKSSLQFILNSTNVPWVHITILDVLHEHIESAEHLACPASLSRRAGSDSPYVRCPNNTVKLRLKVAVNATVLNQALNNSVSDVLEHDHAFDAVTINGDDFLVFVSEYNIALNEMFNYERAEWGSPDSDAGYSIADTFALEIIEHYFTTDFIYEHLMASDVSRVWTRP